MVERQVPGLAGASAELVARLQANVPQAMKDRRQWLLWKFVRGRKIPFYVGGRKRKGGQGSPEDRAALATFDEAVAALAAGRWDGIGFAFLPGDALVGIDVDDAIDGEGVFSPLALEVLGLCGSYAELSPSRRGLHVICQAPPGVEVSSFRENSIGLEVYSGRQFFTVTGDRWGEPTQVTEVSAEVFDRLVALRAHARASAKAGQASAPSDRGPLPQPTRASGVAPGHAVGDFRAVNEAALANLARWVPQALPEARHYEATGAWRVTSKALGRSMQEDLSLHPKGIWDYGPEESMTAVDVLVQFRGMKPREALEWLAAQLGIALAGAAGRARAPGAVAGSSTPSTGSGRPVEARASAPPPACPPDDVPPPDDEHDPHWMKRLIRQGNNGLKDCRENIFIALTNHPALKGMVAYDEFAHRILKVRQPPWDAPPGEWADNDDFFLGLWLSENLRLTIRGESTIMSGVAMAAYEARFHPVRRYLAELPPWDGIERLPYWLSECLGAEDKTFTRLVGTWFVMGMVRRVQQPGCQMDYMIVLEGLQGKRKSTALRTLVGNDEWFADTPIRIGDKDALLSLAGKWLYEIGEMDSFNRAETTAVKQYVVSRIDRVREPFARRPADRPRSGVFAGTTNQAEYFKDPTGARRFWPVACDGDIDIPKLAEWRDKLYAEALARLASEDPEVSRYYPTRAETDDFLVPEQEQREISDPWFERLARWVNSTQKFGDTLDEVREVEAFTSEELLTKAIGVPMDRIDGNRAMSTRIGIAMHKLGWNKRRDPTGARLWRYWRPAASAAPASPPPAAAGPLSRNGGAEAPARSVETVSGVDPW